MKIQEFKTSLLSSIYFICYASIELSEVDRRYCNFYLTIVWQSISRSTISIDLLLYSDELVYFFYSLLLAKGTVAIDSLLLSQRNVCDLMSFSKRWPKLKNKKQLEVKIGQYKSFLAAAGIYFSLGLTLRSWHLYYKVRFPLYIYRYI